MVSGKASLTHYHVRFVTLSQLFRPGESVNDLMELNLTCSNHISGLVDLRWSLVSGERCGKASLHGITLSLGMLDIVRMSPINWGKSLLFFYYNFLMQKRDILIIYLLGNLTVKTVMYVLI